MSSLDGKRILVIDDDPYLLTLLECTFSMEGAQVCAAASGVEGLRHLSEHQPHLIILDVVMPGMKGWEVSRRIRQFSNTPIIFLSAVSSKDDITRGFQSGAIDYIIKPFGLDVLLDRARAALHRVERAFAVENPLLCTATDGE